MNVIQISGNKGGIGKSLMTHIAVHALTLTHHKSKMKVAILEADSGNRDIERIYLPKVGTGNIDQVMTVNLLSQTGIEDYFGVLSELHDCGCTHVVVNEPAGTGSTNGLSIEQLREQHALLTEALLSIDTNITTVFMAVDDPVSSNTLHQLVQTQDPNSIVVIKNPLSGVKFDVLNRMIDKVAFKTVMELPLLNAQFTDLVRNSKLSAADALEALKPVNRLMYMRVNAAIEHIATDIVKAIGGV